MVVLKDLVHTYIRLAVKRTLIEFFYRIQESKAIPIQGMPIVKDLNGRFYFQALDGRIWVMLPVYVS